MLLSGGAQIRSSPPPVREMAAAEAMPIRCNRKMNWFRLEAMGTPGLTVSEGRRPTSHCEGPKAPKQSRRSNRHNYKQLSARGAGLFSYGLVARAFIRSSNIAVPIDLRALPLARPFCRGLSPRHGLNCMKTTGTQVKQNSTPTDE